MSPRPPARPRRRPLRPWRPVPHAAVLGAFAVSLATLPAPVIEAKAPGVRHCYKTVCHRVRTIEETRRLIGKTRLITASHYNFPHLDRFNTGTYTSNGERFHAGLSDRVSSSDLPDGTELIIRNPANGRTAHVRVNDFGPFHGTRKLDVTRRVADDLGFAKQGVIDLEVTVIAAPLPEDLVYRRNRPRLSARGFLGAIADGDMPALIRRKIAERTPVDPATILAAAPQPDPEPTIAITASEPFAAGLAPIALEPEPSLDTALTAAAAATPAPEAEPAGDALLAANDSAVETVASPPPSTSDLPPIIALTEPPAEIADVTPGIDHDLGAGETQRMSAAITMAEAEPLADVEVASEIASASASGPVVANVAPDPIASAQEQPPAFAAASSAPGPAGHVRHASPAPLLTPSSLILALIMAMLSALMAASATHRPRTTPARSADRSLLKADRRPSAAAPVSLDDFAPTSTASPPIDDARTDTAVVAPAPAPRVTFIAPGTAITAHLSGRGRVVVAGSLAGTFDVGAVVVLPGGHLHGEVTADTVEIDGDFHGALTARRVFLKPNAHARGLIDAVELSVDEGASLDADIRSRRAP